MSIQQWAVLERDGDYAVVQFQTGRQYGGVVVFVTGSKDAAYAEMRRRESRWWVRIISTTVIFTLVLFAIITTLFAYETHSRTDSQDARADACAAQREACEDAAQQNR